MPSRPLPILPIDGVPPELIQVLNTRLRDLAAQTSSTAAAPAPVVPVLPTSDTAVSVSGVLVPGALQSTSDFKGDHLSVKDWKAVGDGVADDTLKIQAAIDYVAAHGGSLYIPPGIYLISSTIFIRTGIVIEGASGALGKTRLLYTGAGTAVKVINPSPTSAVPWVFRVYISNLSIVSTQGWNVALCGLDLHNVSEFDLKDVFAGTSNANGFAVGIRAAVNIGVMRGIVPAGNHVGLSLEWTDEPLGPIVPCTTLDLGGESNFFNNDVAIAIYGLAESHIHDCWFEEFHNAFLIDNSLSPAEGCVIHDVTVDNCGFAGYTTAAYTDNRALRLQSTNNAEVVSVINFRWMMNTCFAVGAHVIEFVVTGSHANTVFEGDFSFNAFWGGTAGGINADSAGKVFVMLHQNDSRDGFFGASVPDVDLAAVISANGFDYLINDFQYAHFRQGLKADFSSKFRTPLGDAVFVIGPTGAYISFSADDGVTTHGVIGYPTPSNLALQIVNNATGEPIVIQTTGGGQIEIRGGALETDAGYGALGAGTLNPTYGGGGGSPHVGSVSWGDGSGYTYIFGTSIAGVFTPRFTFKDNGDLLVSGNLTVTGTPPGGAPSGTAGGDLGGTYPNPTLAKIAGNPVSAGSPNVGDALTWDGSDWVPDPQEFGTTVATTGDGTHVAGISIDAKQRISGLTPIAITFPVVSASDTYFAARSSSIGTQTVASLAAGRYLVSVALETTTSGAGTVLWTIGWTSAGTGRSISTGTLALSAPMLTSEYTQIYVINVDASSSFTYSTTYAGPGAYAFSMTLTKL